MPLTPSCYGSLYWCVKSPESQSGEIYLYAEAVDLRPDGSLVCTSNEGWPVMIFAPGQWYAIYAASVLDGSPVAIEHWEGEVVSPSVGCLT